MFLDNQYSCICVDNFLLFQMVGHLEDRLIPMSIQQIPSLIADEYPLDGSSVCLFGKKCYHTQSIVNQHLCGWLGVCVSDVYNEIIFHMYHIHVEMFAVLQLYECTNWQHCGLCILNCHTQTWGLYGKSSALSENVVFWF